MTVFPQGMAMGSAYGLPPLRLISDRNTSSDSGAGYVFSGGDLSSVSFSNEHLVVIASVYENNNFSEIQSCTLRDDSDNSTINSMTEIIKQSTSPFSSCISSAIYITSSPITFSGDINFNVPTSNDTNSAALKVYAIPANSLYSNSAVDTATDEDTTSLSDTLTTQKRNTILFIAYNGVTSLSITSPLNYPGHNGDSVDDMGDSGADYVIDAYYVSNPTTLTISATAGGSRSHFVAAAFR